jgi:glycosyltransferase involved in cell wall biosynthesis
MNPLVSVLIPCYNREKLVKDSIDSALKQTYQNIEVIVVNDGSTDNTLSVIKSYGDRIKYIDASNQGACAARNTALKLCQGEFVQFLDSDDILDHSKVEKQLPILLGDLADISFCQADYFNECGPLISNHPGYPPPKGDHLDYILSYNYATTLPLHKKRWLELIGGFRENLKRAQDTDLHIRLVSRGARIHVMPDRLVHIRLHDGPRISAQKSSADHMLKILLNAYYENKDSIKKNLQRRNILAKYILINSIYAFRGNKKAEALVGFDVSKKLKYSRLHPCGGFALKCIAMLIGVQKSEILREKIGHSLRK